MSTAEILANLYDSTRDEMGDSGAWDNVVRSEHFIQYKVLIWII